MDAVQPQKKRKKENISLRALEERVGREEVFKDPQAG